MVTTLGAAKLALTLTASLGTAAALAYIAYTTHQPVSSTVLVVHLTHSQSGTIAATWKSCNWPAGNQPGNNYAVIDSTLCLALPLFRLLQSDLLTIGSLSLAFSGLLPLLTHLSYVAISPNARLGFLTTTTPIFVVASHFIGAGILAAGPLVILYTIGSLFYFARTSHLAPIPTPAIGAYVLNSLLFIYSIAAFGIMYFNPDGPNWYKCFLALLLVPAALLNLPTITSGYKVARTQADVRQSLSTYTASEVSSGFERTWSSYRRFGFISSVFYWYGIGRIANAFIYERASLHLNDASLHSLLTFTGLSTALLALISIERLTYRPRASSIASTRIFTVPANTKTEVSQVDEQRALVHPLTGREPGKLELECEAAIARAPAGYPIVEIGWKGTALAALLGGPGLAACFWWARGEEEAGWKSRREWREVQALASKKQ
ncbi:hypothetical protein V8E36_005031 [Tilletia maclaganii]